MCGIEGRVKTFWFKAPLDSINHRWPNNRNNHMITENMDKNFNFTIKTIHRK